MTNDFAKTANLLQRGRAPALVCVTAYILTHHLDFSIMNCFEINSK